MQKYNIHKINFDKVEQTQLPKYNLKKLYVQVKMWIKKNLNLFAKLSKKPLKLKMIRLRNENITERTEINKLSFVIS